MSQVFDVVIFGATSFVGKILTDYLAHNFDQDKDFTWAIAGRSAAKLNAVKVELGEQGKTLATIVVDAKDDAGLAEMCQQARLIVSTVGPYALYGEPLIKACVTTGTDYFDLTGEPHWIKRMLSRYEEQAKKSGARIVHCCGFDSIPSDLGVHFLQQRAKEKFGNYCTTVDMRVTRFIGTFSGGTLASVMNFCKEASADRTLIKDLADPYSLCPASTDNLIKQKNVIGKFDQNSNGWTAPFIMEAINIRIVHRSHALAGYPYGKDFLYSEAVLKSPNLKGRFSAAFEKFASNSFYILGAIGITRSLLENYVLTKPGNGPTKEQQINGKYTFDFIGKTNDGQTIKVIVAGDQDPGYGSTAKILGQAIACWMLDMNKENQLGGFWTPATFFGEQLIPRLHQNAGLTFKVVE